MNEFNKAVEVAAKAFKEPYLKTYKSIWVDCICHQELFHSGECIRHTLRAQPPTPTIPQRLIAAYCEGATWGREFGIAEAVKWLRSKEGDDAIRIPGANIPHGMTPAWFTALTIEAKFGVSDGKAK